MVVTVDIKDTNLSRISVFTRDSRGGASGGGLKRYGNGGGIFEDTEDGCMSMSYKQRLYGFLICLAAGAVVFGLVRKQRTNIFLIYYVVVVFQFCEAEDVCCIFFAGKRDSHLQVSPRIILTTH